MNSITIGKNAAGKDIVLTKKMRQSTHMHVVGGSGKGKSKFLESLIRKDLRAGNGLCLIDWHGTLYKDVLRYCAYLDIGLQNDFRKVFLINPSEPRFITGFNPFINQGGDTSVQVSRRINATIKPWGMNNTHDMPTFHSVMYALYSFAVEMNETLPNAARLLEYDRPELRHWAANMVRDREGQRQLKRLINNETWREWKEFVLSSDNRLGLFLGSNAVRRFMGLKTGNLNLMQAMNEGHIILVNLGASDYLDDEAGRVFASLFLYEFFETAMRRANQSPHNEKPETYSLYLDEFQEYITDDIAAMLDQVRKGGLHLVLAHQHFGHFLDNKRLLKSVLTNARLRAVFGGLDYEDASLIANEMFLPDLNVRQIKKAYYHTTHLYEEQERLVRAYSRSGGNSRSSNWTEGSGYNSTQGNSFGRNSGTGRSFGHSSSRGTSRTSGESESFGDSKASGRSFGAFGDEDGMINTEGWFSESESSSKNSARAYSESRTSSESQTDSESHSSFASESYSLSEAETFSESRSNGGGISVSESRTEGVSIVPVWVPIPKKELSSETEWTREEKVSRVVEILKAQQERHCFIKLDEEKTQPLLVPFVNDYPMSQEILLEYEQDVYTQQNALPSAEVDRLMQQSEADFLASANAQNTVPAKPAKQQKVKTPKKAKETIKNPPSSKTNKKTLFQRIVDDNPDLYSDS